MFFILSKILGLLFKPLLIMGLLGLYACFGPIKRRNRSLKTLVILFIFFSNPWIINELARAWEIGKINPNTLTQPYEVGILLGGYTDTGVDNPGGIVTFNRASNRITETLALYKMGKIKHILLTGGSGKVIGAEESEAPLARWYLQQVGVPDSAIWIEGASRNTRENALFSKTLVDSIAPGSRCLLITSAWHLRRAEGCFQKANLPCDIFGTDSFTDTEEGNPLHWLEPDWKALMKWEYLLKEWVGWLVYKVKGWA